MSSVCLTSVSVLFLKCVIVVFFPNFLVQTLKCQQETNNINEKQLDSPYR